MKNWLLLHYQLPAQPSASRVYIWRKLKRLAAILLNDSVWVLPDTSWTAEQFQWLVAEIHERKGEAFLWRSDPILGVQEEVLVKQFVEQVDREYKELLKKMNRKKPDLAELSRLYQQVVAADYFHSALGREVREKLLSLRGEKG